MTRTCTRKFHQSGSSFDVDHTSVFRPTRSTTAGLSLHPGGRNSVLLQGRSHRRKHTETTEWHTLWKYVVRTPEQKFTDSDPVFSRVRGKLPNACFRHKRMQLQQRRLRAHVRGSSARHHQTEFTGLQMSLCRRLSHGH